MEADRPIQQWLILNAGGRVVTVMDHAWITEDGGR